MKDFIPYALALQLKELGFDEDCFAIWSGFDEINFSVTDTVRLYSSEFRINGTQSARFYINDFNSCRVAAPTFSQSFRFFREKYGLECVIDINTKFINNFQPVEKLYKIQIIKSDEYSTERHNKLLDTKLNITSFEEAELECLRRLISVVS